MLSTQTLSCEFCEISHNAFFKETFGRLLLYNTRSVYFPTTTFHLFRKDVICVPAEFYLGLICILGTRMSSIFQTLSQKPESYFQLSLTSVMELFFAKIVSSLKLLSIFTRKAPL